MAQRHALMVLTQGAPGQSWQQFSPVFLMFVQYGSRSPGSCNSSIRRKNFARTPTCIAKKNLTRAGTVFAFTVGNSS